MARTGYGKVLGWGLAIGAVAGAMSLFRGKAKASMIPVAPRAPVAKGPKQKFAPGDEVTVTGGPTGSARTYIVRGATLTPTGWQYDLGEGATMPQSALHFVSSAAERGTAPVMVKAAPVVPVAPAREKAAKVAALKAAPNQGGPKMTQRQQRITDLLGLVKTEKDAAKLAALKAELVKLAQEESAAIKAPPVTPKPMYPVGLEVAFGKRKATITSAKQDAQGVWQYTAYVKSGEPFGIGSKSYDFNEAQLREAMQKEVGVIQPGQFAVANVTVYRNGQGGYIQKAEKNAAGVWIYTVAGWPNPVLQSELLSILRRA